MSGGEDSVDRQFKPSNTKTKEWVPDTGKTANLDLSNLNVASSDANHVKLDDTKEHDKPVHRIPAKHTSRLIKLVSLSMIVLGTLISVASTVVSLDTGSNGFISKTSYWIVCNTPLQMFGGCIPTEAELWKDSSSTQNDPSETLVKPTSLVNTDEELVNKVREQYLKNMEGQDIMTIDDLSFRPRSAGHFSKNMTQIGAENATFYMLVRNSELSQTLQTMREIEDRFNKDYKYPWTFLNDLPFTDEFKNLTSGMASGKTEYGLVPTEFWSVPDFINNKTFEAALKKFEADGIIYGGSTSYRHMCRFNSGFFFRHALMNQYKYYWRVEPGTHLFCDQRYDPFTFMRENKKRYGFVITIPEYASTIPTLWPTVETFFETHPEYVAANSAQRFLTDKTLTRPEDLLLLSPTRYNLCHFWSNFEIGDLDFFRSQEYLDYFEHLDRSGGFFYERWGDAPVHSIGVVMMMNKSEIHHFSDIGYKHHPYYRCPHDEESYTSGRCYCGSEKMEDNVDFQPFSCLPRWWVHGGKPFLYKYKDELILM